MAKDASGCPVRADRERPLLAFLTPVLLVALAIPSAAQGTWTPTSTAGSPQARFGHTAVWTGSKMIAWGGYDGSSPLNTGGVYDPASDTWTATSTTNAPAARHGHSAVWTGSRMIVWSGVSVAAWDNTGGVYDPATDTWTATSTTNAPSARRWHTAVWTGSKTIVWGGLYSAYLDSGGTYDPATDTWAATSTTNAPTARDGHTAVWTGSRMIVWGGYLASSTGGVYDPETPPPPPADFYPLTPCRAVDTRDAVGPRGGPAIEVGRCFALTLVCGVPSTARAVSVNLTVVGPTAPGYLGFYPSCGSGFVSTSFVNFRPGTTRANNAILRLATDGSGTVMVMNRSAGTVHLVLDVNGYFQ